MEEAEQPTMASTPSLSTHFRAWATPMSGLFWSSAMTTSTGTPLTEPPWSSMASLTEVTEPAPQLSA